VLDIGCGTGCLALLLATAGHTVVAVGPAQASLEVAQAFTSGFQVLDVRDAPDRPGLEFVFIAQRTTPGLPLP